MRLPDTLKKIKDYPDLPKDIFVTLLILLVGLGAFFLGRLSVFDETQKGNLQIRNTLSAVAGGAESGGVRKGEAATAHAGVVVVDNQFISSSLNSAPPISEATNSKGAYVASKTGHVYYLSSCGGVKRIKEENKVWFASKGDAELKGYKPAATCKGM